MPSVKKAAAVVEEAKPVANKLGKTQLTVLEMLRDQGPLGRDKMIEATGVQKGWSRVLGAGSKEGMGTHGDTSLAGRGFVTIGQVEGVRGFVYSITTAGKQALAAALKEAAKAEAQAAAAPAKEPKAAKVEKAAPKAAKVAAPKAPAVKPVKAAKPKAEVAPKPAE